MKVSLLMPVYNAVRTLGKSLDSVAAQSYCGELELCVADDCSTDGSVELLEQFRRSFEVSGKRELRLVRHSSNQGVAAARNTLLDLADGQLVCWLDADDLLSPTAVEDFVKVFETTAADIVGFDWTLASDAGARYMRQPDCTDTETALKALMGGTLRWNLWLFASRRQLFEGLRFSPGMNMGEDMMAVGCLLMKASSFGQLHKSLYTYIQTGSSISKVMSDENLRQSCANVELFSAALLSSPYTHLSRPYLDLLKLNVKLPLLVSEDKNDYIRWLNCYPETSRSILDNSHLPLRTKVLQLMASKRLWLAVRLYNKIVYKLLYGILLCRKH